VLIKSNAKTNKNKDKYLFLLFDCQRDPHQHPKSAASTLLRKNGFVSGETSERIDSTRMARSIFGKKEKNPLTLKKLVFFCEALPPKGENVTLVIAFNNLG